MTVTTNPTKICQPNSDNAHDYTYQPVVQTGPERMQAEIDALRAELMEINSRLAHLEAVVHRLLNSDEEPDAETVQP